MVMMKIAKSVKNNAGKSVFSSQKLDKFYFDVGSITKMFEVISRVKQYIYDGSSNHRTQTTTFLCARSSDGKRDGPGTSRQAPG